MIQGIRNRLTRRLLHYLSVSENTDKNTIVVDKTSILKYEEGFNQNINTTNIYIQEKSTVELGKEVSFKNCNINVEDNSVLKIADNCHFENITLRVSSNSKVFIAEYCTFNPPKKYSSSISLNRGAEISIDKYSIILATIQVDFKGTLKIGEYSGIGYDSEIRCHEQVNIGDYALFSYGVCIYDTNTHSLDSEYRREQKRKAHPNRYGIFEIERPNTKPVIIGSDVWIGKQATITKGTRIGNGCIIGIRTVVGGGEYEDDSSIVAQKPRVITRKIS